MGNLYKEVLENIPTAAIVVDKEVGVRYLSTAKLNNIKDKTIKSS